MKIAIVASMKFSKNMIDVNNNLIEASYDTVLPVGVENHIGGNTFLEMAFACVLNKPIYLLNPIPELSYTSELEAMEPIVLD